METHLLFFIASVGGGAINVIAGGGGLITLPLLMHVAGPRKHSGMRQVLSPGSPLIQQQFGAPEAYCMESSARAGYGCC